MTTPLYLVPGAYGFVLTLFHILSVLSAFCMITCRKNKSNIKYRILMSVYFIFVFLMMLFIIDAFRKTFTSPLFIRMSDIFLNLPAVIVFLFILLQYIFVIWFLFRIYQWKKNNITLMSVKEGTDILPMGICIYSENGIPELVNHSMNNLSLELCGSSVLNGKVFWQSISEGRITEGAKSIKTGDRPLIKMQNGSIIAFRNVLRKENNQCYYEISASDITSQYNLRQKLIDYNNDIRNLNRRLELYGENLLQITREKEILDAKIRIHDNLGKSLLAAKRFIENGKKDSDSKSVLGMWKDNISLLQNNSDKNGEDSLQDLYEAAELMGIKINIDGEIPYENTKTLRFLMAGARESITNAVHHAGATELSIKIYSSSNFNIIEFRNNGDKPLSDIISEGGGLSGLRKSIENAGGNMETQAKPRFVLKLIIPK